MLICHINYGDQPDCNGKESLNSDEITVGDRFKRLDFHKTDWELLKKEIGEFIDWSILPSLNPADGLQYFYLKLLDVCEKVVPQRKK